LDYFLTMQSRKLFLWPLLILAITSPTVSSYAQNDAFLEKLRSQNQFLVSFQARFAQTKKSPILEDDLLSSGMLYFKKDRNIRWEQQKPVAHILILNQDSMYEYRADVTASKRPISGTFRQFQNLITNVVNGTFIRESYHSAEVWKQGDLIHYRITDPKGKMKKLIREIELTFDRESAFLMQLRFIDRSEQQIKIVFTEHQINHLENSLFAIPDE
jgi:outer membrane lipoprotein-sorting protein